MRLLLIRAPVSRTPCCVLHERARTSRIVPFTRKAGFSTRSWPTKYIQLQYSFEYDYHDAVSGEPQGRDFLTREQSRSCLAKIARLWNETNTFFKHASACVCYELFAAQTNDNLKQVINEWFDENTRPDSRCCARDKECH